MTDEEKYTTLDTEQCKWWVNNLFGMAKEKACNSHNFDDGEEIQSAQDKIIKTLEIVEEFERAQIITGGRLNGRAFAYKCGLEAGKRKKGKWLKYEKEFTESGTWRQMKRSVIECSICQEKIVGYIGIMNYCPNCGADMRGAENESK